MMANKLIRALFVYSLALIYGFMVCLVILLRAIWNLEIPTRGKRREKRKYQSVNLHRFSEPDLLCSIVRVYLVSIRSGFCV